jgi:hypothetical protein
VTQLIEKRTKFTLLSYIAFVDKTKAFDMVNRNMLWHKLKVKDLPGHPIRLIHSLHAGTYRILSSRMEAEEVTEIILINQNVLQDAHYHPSFLISLWTTL